MATHEIRNGQREYGIVHVVEEEMRAAGDGVFGSRSNAARRRKSEVVRETKDEGGAPENKSTARTVTSGRVPGRNAARKGK